jgi:hypothetical protein
VFLPMTHPLANATGPSSLGVIRADDLTEVADICLDPVLTDYAFAPLEAAACHPPPLTTYGLGTGNAFPQPHIVGLSWHSADDDLVVLTDNRGSTPQLSVQQQPPSHGPTVVVSDFHVQIDGTGAPTLVHRWSYALSSTNCTVGVFNGVEIAPAAIRTAGAREEAVFVPCQFDVEPADAASTQQFAVVKVSLSAQCTDGKLQYPCPGATPLVQSTASPVAYAGFMLDPVGERGFLPVSQSAGTGSGVPLLVYEGAGTPTFSTHIVVGKAGSSSSAMEWALDSVRGRVYAMDLAAGGYGMTLIDTRRTPLGIGTQLPEIHPSALGGLASDIPLMPPDVNHSSTWLILPWITDQITNSNVTGARMRQLTVVGDGLSVTADPAIPNVDSGNTDTSPPPAGSVIQRSFGGSVGGYAAHLTLVGGYGAPIRTVEDSGGHSAGFIQRNDPTRNLAGANAQVNVLTANVDQLSLANGAATGAAAALNDGNGDASHQYQRCTEVADIPDCQAPHCPMQALGSTVDVCQAAYSAAPPKALTSPYSTGQRWPSYMAQCSNPGPADAQTSTQVGLYYDQPRSAQATGAPSSAPLPGTDASGKGSSVNPDGGVRAHVDCVSNHGIEGDAWTPKLFASFGGADVTLSSGYTVASVLPPSNELGSTIQSTSTSEIRNIAVTLGSAQGSGEIRIGIVKQTATAFAGGRPGTAGTTRTTLIGDLDVVDGQGSHHHFCAGGGSEFAAQASGCPLGSDNLQQALAGVNQIAPTRFAILAPMPTTPFGTGGDGAPKGSPGGYTAQVAASPAEQLGDQQFNGMSSTQASYLPALRIVIYQDSASQVAREVIDLAGVEADAHQGLQFVSGSEGGGTSGGPSVTSDDAAKAAGLSPVQIRTIVDRRIGKTDRPNVFVPSATGPLAIVQRVLAGLEWLRRSPAEAAEMAGLMGLFGVPIVLMARRRTWATHLVGEGQ